MRLCVFCQRCMYCIFCTGVAANGVIINWLNVYYSFVAWARLRYTKNTLNTQKEFFADLPFDTHDPTQPAAHHNNKCLLLSHYFGRTHHWYIRRLTPEIIIIPVIIQLLQFGPNTRELCFRRWRTVPLAIPTFILVALKMRGGKCGSRSQEWKIQQWKMRE